MAELGSYYITIMPSMKGFTSQVHKELGDLGNAGGSKFSGGFLDVLKGSAIGTTLGNLASKAGNSIMDGLSTGISRLDTIQNYPRVMESLGYSTDEADKSIRTIMDHLDGLPTATQDMVTLTQAISDSTGDLDLATRAALGFNDMMLANGASAAEVATAQGVLNRVLGKGSATAAQWQSLTSVMPAQLGLVAKHMLGAGASTEDLHEALENGTVGWNDFLQAIADLDKSGYIDEAGRQIASFEEQARANSDGIGTAIDNIKNRIGAGWADILAAIGRSDISGAINTMSYGVRDGMSRIADGITYVKDAIADTSIGENLGKIGKGIGDFLDKVSKAAGPVLKEFADVMVDFIDRALQWVVDHGDLVTSILASLATALALKEAAGAASTLMGAAKGLSALGEALPMVTGLKDLPAAFTLAAESGGPLAGMFTGLGGIIEWCATNPMVLIAGAIAAVVAGLVWFFTQTEKGQEIWQGFCDLFSELATGLQEDWSGFCEVCSREWESFTAFVDGLPEWWEGVKQFWGDALNEQAENFKLAGDKIKSDFGEAWEGIKNDASAKWDTISTNVTNAANTMGTNLSTAWEDIKNKASNSVTSIKDSMSNGFGLAKDSVLDIFDRIKDNIRDKMEWARDRVSSIIEGIKSLFNFSWSLPAPKLPHINYHWRDIGGVLSIPVFDGISWYAKGGIFDRPTLAGLGEAGKEAALPLNKRTYGQIAHGIASEMGGTGGVTIEKIADTLIVRNEDDIDYIINEVSRRTARERMAMA